MQLELNLPSATGRTEQLQRTSTILSAVLHRHVCACMERISALQKYLVMVMTGQSLLHTTTIVLPSPAPR